MAIQMTRAEYEAKYGQPAPKPAPIKMTRAEYAAKYQQPKATLPANTSKPLFQKVLDTGTTVANFFGAKSISEQFGADIARARLPEAQKNLVSYPSMKSVLGSAVQTGANLIPGAGVGASTVARVAQGAATGYAIDVGSKLQNNTPTTKALMPGVGTTLGAALPLAGKLSGFSNVASKTKKLANALEGQNLRMTPVEKQNLAKRGKDLSNFLASKKLIGTPDQRLAKVVSLNDDMERQITRVVDTSRITYPKKAIIAQLQQIPSKYIDNLSEYDGIVSKVDRIIKTLEANKGDSITASALNRMKRNEWANAFNRNNSNVVNEVSEEVGHVFKNLLDTSVKGLGKLNKEYGLLLDARKQLTRAASRNQAGLFGRAIGLTGGTAIGASVGGGVGAAAGAFIGERAANLTATPVRSIVGAGLQKASETIKSLPLRGTVQPIRKSLLQGASLFQPQQKTTMQSSPNKEALAPLQANSYQKPTTHPATVKADGSITVKGPLSGKNIPLPNIGLSAGYSAKKVLEIARKMDSVDKAALKEIIAKFNNGNPRVFIGLRERYGRFLDAIGATKLPEKDQLPYLKALLRSSNK